MISFCEFSVDGLEWMTEWMDDDEDDTVGVVIIGGDSSSCCSSSSSSRSSSSSSSSSTMEMKDDGCDELNRTSGNQLLQAPLT